MPSCHIAGDRDVVLLMAGDAVPRMSAELPGFRGQTLLPGVGHWTQQEAPAAFDEALLSFLAGLADAPQPAGDVTSARRRTAAARPPPRARSSAPAAVRPQQRARRRSPAALPTGVHVRGSGTRRSSART